MALVFYVILSSGDCLLHHWVKLALNNFVELSFEGLYTYHQKWLCYLSYFSILCNCIKGCILVITGYQLYNISKININECVLQIIFHYCTL